MKENASEKKQEDETDEGEEAGSRKDTICWQQGRGILLLPKPSCAHLQEV